MYLRKQAPLLAIYFLLVGLPACANAQTREDPCEGVQLKGAAKQADYRLKRAQLQASSDDFRSADLALSEAQLALTKRVSKDLVGPRFNAETAKMKVVLSDATVETVAAIGDACLKRLSKFPQAEIAAMNESAKAIQSLVALPSPQFEEEYKQDTARIERDYANEAAAVQALKRTLERVRGQLK